MSYGPFSPGGRNRQNRPNGTDITHFSAFKPPRGNPYPDAPGPLVPWDETEIESEAPFMSYSRNRQYLLSGPRSCPFFSVQASAWLSPHPDAPDSWSRGTKQKWNRRSGS